MTHRNAPLTPEGRLRLVRRCQHRPIAHIAAEAGVSRQCLGKWVARYREHGEAGLVDHSSAPARRPTQTPVAVVEQIAAMRADLSPRVAAYAGSCANSRPRTSPSRWPR